MFRKNKLNSVQAALARRNSAARLQQDYDEKMEAKGVPNIYGDDEKHGTAAKNGMIPDDAQKQAIIAQVPTDDEIVELMKGKSKPEKRRLLKEIEKARQQKIHLEYILAQQKDKNDERWAVRNVQER